MQGGLKRICSLFYFLPALFRLYQPCTDYLEDDFSDVGNIPGKNGQ